MYGWCYPPNKIKWRTMHTIIFITWFYNLLSASENLIWPFPTHLPLLGLFLPFHTSRHLPTAVLFSSFRVTHGKNYGGVFFFSEDPSVKLGFLPLSSLRWDRQVASEPKCPHSPHLSPLLPSAQGWVWVSSLLPDTCQRSTARTQGNGRAALRVATESGLC